MLGVTISGDGTNDGPVGTGTLDGRLRKTPWPSSTHHGAERRRTHPRRAPVVHAHIRTFGLRSTLEESGRPVAGMSPPHGPADDTPVGERRCPWRPGRREGHVSVEQQHVNQRGNQPRVPVGIGLLVLPRVSIHIRQQPPPDVSFRRTFPLPVAPTRANVDGRPPPVAAGKEDPRP